jgi:hypothetical protein
MGLGWVDCLRVFMVDLGFTGLAALGDAQTARTASVALDSHSLPRRHSFVSQLVVTAVSRIRQNIFD